MAKHLSKKDIMAIVNLIRGWNESKLTWSAICSEAEPLIGKLPTRQSLNAHEVIVTAYRTKKGDLKVQGSQNPCPSSMKIATARIKNLESEIRELKDENRRYKQQFVIWQYNAYKHGMKEHQLNMSMPKIDRERSDTEKR